LKINSRGYSQSVQIEPTVTLRNLVSRNIARLRADAQAPVERVVQAAAGYGLEWTPSWLQSVEHGNRALNAEQLLLMPLVLSSALAHRVTLADLLSGEQPVEVSPEKQVSPAHLREVVTGEPSHRPFTTSAPDTTTMLMASNQQAVEKMRTVRDANLGDVDVRTLGQAEAGAGQTEARLAKRLGVPVIVVIAAAASLWGRSLSDERDALIKQDPAEANVITRRLSAAVSARIAEAAEAAKSCAEPEVVSA
jgi:hypothetical protein